MGLEDKFSLEPIDLISFEDGKPRVYGKPVEITPLGGPVLINYVPPESDWDKKTRVLEGLKRIKPDLIALGILPRANGYVLGAYRFIEGENWFTKIPIQLYEVKELESGLRDKEK